MNFIKSFLFFYFFMMFHGISYAMKTELVLSDKAQEVANFFVDRKIISEQRAQELIKYKLEAQELSEEESKVQNLIKHFNKEDSGVPIYVDFLELVRKEALEREKKISWKSRFNKIFNNIQEGIFGYPFSEWKFKFQKEWARARGKYDSYSGPEYRENKEATELLLDLRRVTEIPSNIRIPVFELPTIKKLSSVNDISMDDAGLSVGINNNGFLTYAISVDAEFYKKLNKAEQSIVLAHEDGHRKIGSSSYRNLLGTKMLLGASFGLASYGILQGQDFQYNWIKPCIYGLSGLYGVLYANQFKHFYTRLEEKACDLRAIEICHKANTLSAQDVCQGKGLGFLSYFDDKCEPIVLGEFGKIQNAKGTVAYRYGFFEKQHKRVEKPFEYGPKQWTRARHPSPAERVRYCKKHAEGLASRSKSTQIITS